MPSGTTFEADLRAAREARGLSLGDIQQQTRIPVDVLRRFEAGDLIGDPTYNEVYLKAFLQSYAKAVGASPSAVVAAYQDHKAGAYAGALHPEHKPGAGPKETPPVVETPAAAPTPPPPPPPAGDARAAGDAPPAQGATRPSAPAAGSSAPPAVQALRTAPNQEDRPAPPPERPQTLAQARVNRPAVPGARRSFDKNWGTILGLFAVLVVALGLAMYFLVFAGGSPGEGDDPETVAVGADPEEEPAAVDSAGVGAGAAAGAPQLQFPLRVTVTAGGDGLQWFRVTEDGGDRLPHWIDAGASQTFEADSSLVLWGEGNESAPAYAFEETTVEIQGQRFTPPSGAALRIDRQRGQRLLDSLATATPAPPAPAEGAEPPPVDPGAFE